MQSEFLEEMIALRSIFSDELDESYLSDTCVKLSVRINPNKGLSSSDEFLLFFNLIITCSHEYPNVPPKLQILQARGFTDDNVLNMLSQLQKQAKESCGLAMIYDLIQTAKAMTESDTPTISCPICMEEFQQSCDVYRTPEYHYFHKICIAHYMQEKKIAFDAEMNELMEKNPHIQRSELPIFEIPCPICRKEILPFDADLVKSFACQFSQWSKQPDLSSSSATANTTTESYEIPLSWLSLRESLAQLKTKQIEKYLLQQQNSKLNSNEVAVVGVEGNNSIANPQEAPPAAAAPSNNSHLKRNFNPNFHHHFHSPQHHHVSSYHRPPYRGRKPQQQQYHHHFNPHPRPNVGGGYSNRSAQNNNVKTNCNRPSQTTTPQQSENENHCLDAKGPGDETQQNCNNSNNHSALNNRGNSNSHGSRSRGFSQSKQRHYYSNYQS